MAFFEKIASAFRKKSVLNSWLLGLTNPTGGVGKTFNSRVTKAYKENAVVYGAISLISETAATVPWLLYRRDSEGERQEVSNDSHPINKILRRPNTRQGWSRFIEQQTIYLYLSGDVYLQRATRSRGDRETDPSQPLSLRNLRSDRVELRDGRYVYKPGAAQEEQTFAEEDILHLAFLDPEDEEKGLSPIDPSRASIDSSNFSRWWNNKLLTNDARPMGILKSQVDIPDPAQRERIVNDFVNKFGGWENAGRPPLMTGKIEWESAGLSPRDMEWLAGQRVADRTIAFTLGVASQLLGDSESSTYNNVQEARRSLYEDTVIPLLTWIRDELNSWLLLPFEGFEVDIDVSDIEALQENATDRWNRVANADWLTVNERRTETGFGALEGPNGDIITTKHGLVILPDGKVLGPLGLVPLGSAIPGTTPQNGGDDEGQSSTALELDHKAFDLPRERKAERWQAVDRDRMRFLRPVETIVAKRFREERSSLIMELRARGLQGADTAAEAFFDRQVKKWEESYVKIYTMVGLHFARGTRNSLPKHLAGIALATKDFEDVVAESMRSYVRRVSGSKIVGITESTLGSVKDIVNEGIRAGESIDVISRSIDSLYLDEIIPHRSEVIARTEVISASNAGSFEGARETGVATRKEWIATVTDDRTRVEHLEANGQVVGFDEPFVVGGEQLMWPGDTSLGASAANVINCRCTQGYITT